GAARSPPRSRRSRRGRRRRPSPCPGSTAAEGGCTHARVGQVPRDPPRVRVRSPTPLSLVSTIGGPVCRKIGIGMGLTTHHAGERESGLERLQRVAAVRRPDDQLFSGFMPACYQELPEFDLAERGDDDLYALAQAHLNVGKVRRSGETLIRVLSPDRDRDGWSSERSIVLLVTDDAPFLVDTVRIVLERHGVATHLLVHPMLHVRRTADGELIEVVEGPAPDAIVEAWTQ